MGKYPTDLGKEGGGGGIFSWSISFSIQDID